MLITSHASAYITRSRIVTVSIDRDEFVEDVERGGVTSCTVPKLPNIEYDHYSLDIRLIFLSKHGGVLHDLGYIISSGDDGQLKLTVDGAAFARCIVEVSTEIKEPFTDPAL